MTINEETFEAVLTALGRKRVRCPDAVFKAVEEGGEGWLCPHSEHDHTARMLDPAYNELRAVFQWRRCRAELLPIMEGNTCPIVSRYEYWWGADDGSFEGALMKALLQMWALHNAKIDTIMAALTPMLVNRRGDTRQAACEAVLKWLKETP